MEDATTGRRAHRGGKENEVVKGGCCRAAKQMASNVRKQRLLEEFGKDLIQELEESKRVVGRMKEAHEHEILALTGE